MAVVVDANLVVKLLVGEPGPRALAHRHFAAWAQAEERLVAPHLLEAEVLNALWRTHILGGLDQATIRVRAKLFANLQLTYRALPPAGQIFDVAGRLGQHRAYDACYVALALREGTDVHTMDAHLANAAAQSGLPVVLVA